ncbi:MAG: hypothetical protein JW990_06335 [Thermoleophilia bacterium]|nr:hypothetical protein [Thermoleophilia bacterium]
MKCTRYFLFTRQRPDRAMIREEWVAAAITNPTATERQSDGRIRYYLWVEEAQKYLRVVVLEDDETVHNAFFDRGFRKG